MKGIKASPGIAVGKAYVLSRNIKVGKTMASDRKNELGRLDLAINTSMSQISELLKKPQAKKSRNLAEILEVYMVILQDYEFLSEIRSIITEDGVNAEYAVEITVNKYIEVFNSMDDGYLKERGYDIKDIGKRIISNLYGYPPDIEAMPNNSILVAKELSPCDLVHADKFDIAGFATEEGGDSSHGVIIAKSLGIPGVSGVKGIFDIVCSGDYIIIDGNSGEVLLKPVPELIDLYNNKRLQYVQCIERLEALKGASAVTADGKHIVLNANITARDDIRAIKDMGIQGIGLFRTETLFMDMSRLPQEEEQYRQYRKVLTAMGKKNVTFRTIDIGGDKEVSYLKLEKEPNPALGCRAMRLCFSRTDIFKTQVKAIMRAAVYGNASIMFPMISDTSEIIKAIGILEEVKNDLAKNGTDFVGNIKIGIMIETPAAAVIVDLLAKYADFFSIGTNDLTQYTLAVDRCNNKVKDYYNYFNPGVLRLVKNAVDLAHKFGKPISMCGEMASDPDAVRILLGLGLDTFSMNASSILQIKDIIRKTTMEEARYSAAEALQMKV